MKKISILLVIALMVTGLAGCTGGNEPAGKSTGTAEAAEYNPENAAFIDEKTEIIDVPFEPKEIEPSVGDYEVLPDLGHIRNLDKFGEFTPEQILALGEKGFFIAPVRRDENNPDIDEQLFYIYEDNEYRNIPSFITTDSILHMYHLFYDNFLKDLEETELYPKLIDLTGKMTEASGAQYEELEDGEVKEAALRNTAFFGTGLLTLGEQLPENMPEKAKTLAEEEAAKIENKEGTKSEILNTELDYSQFTVRGHYTQSETLQKYFKTVMYFGQAPFWVKDDFGPRDDLTVMGLLISDLIFKDEEIHKLWSDIYAPLTFLVEGADDLGPMEYGKLLYGVYGKEPNLNKLGDPKKLAAVYEQIDGLPEPEIAGFKGYSFRFMPQRAVLDAVWMQNLLDIAKPGEPSDRPIYNGADVAAVLGSETATKIQLENENNLKWEEYESRLKETTEKVAAMEEEEWQKNLYRGWLWTLKEMTANFGEGYPKFMQTEAWNRKNMNGLLGSWAELKHDTVLYAKQTMAEMGGGGYSDKPKSYVEPNIRVYEKLSWLIEFTKENLKARDMLSEHQEKSLEYFKKLTDRMVHYSEKELKGEPLTEEEYQELTYIGGEMESISIAFVNEDSNYWSLVDENEREMALVSDLMKVPANTLGIPEGEVNHAAIGPAYEIYVIYPIDGDLYLGRGGVFSYREFLAEERYTDEKWRDKVKEEPEIGIPDWAKDLMTQEKPEIPYPDMDY